MAGAKDAQQPTFLRRWSQRKLAAARETVADRPAPAAPVAPAAAQAPAEALPPATAAPSTATGDPSTASLPAVDALTFDSDFRAFLGPKVEEGTRRAALRKLFSDPRFNVMDGLDVYIDDYSKFEPITPEVLAQLDHARYLFDPPKTRVNELGHVEDVVDEPEAPAVAEAEAEPQDAVEAAAADAATTGQAATAVDPADAADTPAATPPAGTVTLADVSPAASREAPLPGPKPPR